MDINWIPFSDINWIPLTGKQIKCSGKLSGIFAAKISNTARTIKDQNVVLLSNERTSLADGERISQIFSNPVTVTTPDTHEVYLGEEYTITAADVSLAVKTVQTLKAGKTADCDEI